MDIKFTFNELKEILCERLNVDPKEYSVGIYTNSHISLFKKEA